jgi:molybdate transport system substrate-binding protein
VSAAISLTDAMEAIGSAYQSEGHGAIRFNFAGSNMLSRQIANGAPVDLFVSADEAQMDLAVKAGAIDVKSRIPLLGNRLAIVTMPAGPAVHDARGLLQPAVRRIALGDPAAVPAGSYARQYLQRAGLWDALAPRVIPVSNVRAALAAVENGSADAAITYESDAAAARQAHAAVVITGPLAPRIVYPAAIVSAAPNRAGAERLLAYLRGPAAAAIFTRFKFVPLGPGA